VSGECVYCEDRFVLLSLVYKPENVNVNVNVNTVLELILSENAVLAVLTNKFG
jgi:hypothetical protein